VGEWVRLCGVAEAPGTNGVMEAEALSREGKGVPICLANVEGRLSALGNVCPHRQGPLGGVWGGAVSVACVGVRCDDGGGSGSGEGKGRGVSSEGRGGGCAGADWVGRVRLRAGRGLPGGILVGGNDRYAEENFCWD